MQSDWTRPPGDHWDKAFRYARLARENARGALKTRVRVSWQSWAARALRADRGAMEHLYQATALLSRAAWG